MNADKYEAINVLIITKGFEREDLQYRLTPYRFHRKNGQVFSIKKIRQHHTEYRGGSKQFHYMVETKKGYYCRLLFDSKTLSWRLTEISKGGLVYE